MTTSQETREKPFLAEIINWEIIPVGKLAYFRARLTNRYHDLVLEEFERLEREGRISKAELARRIGKKPEQITRWLGAAGNWTIETLSDLLLGMACEPSVGITCLAQQATSVEEVGQLPKAVEEKKLPAPAPQPNTANTLANTSTTNIVQFPPRLIDTRELPKIEIAL